MAIIRSAIVARGRKKIGDVVLKRRLGQTIVAQRQLVVHNPKSAKQVIQRSYFKIAMNMTMQARWIVKIIFPLSTYRGTKMNKFTKFFLKKITDVAYPLVHLAANCSATFIGNGSGFTVIPLTVTAIAGGRLTITWSPTAAPVGAPTSGTMSVMAIILNRNAVSFKQEAVLFSAGTGTFFTAPNLLVTGDSIIVALGQTYTDSAGKIQQSPMSFQTVCAAVTVLP